MRWGHPTDGIWLALVLAAPVVGHVFPLFFRFQGGKGIATSFGCLLGLVPNLEPVLILAFSFVFFSTACRSTPHFYRTVLTYLLAPVLMVLSRPGRAIVIGFSVVVQTVLIRMTKSQEEKGHMKVKLLWMH